MKHLLKERSWLSASRKGLSIKQLFIGVLLCLGGCAFGVQSPSAVWIVPVSGGAHVYWNAVLGASKYAVFRGTAPGKEVLVGTAAAPSYGDSGLTNKQSYFYFVEALFGSVDSSPSPEASVVPGSTVLAGPRTVAQPTAGGINVNWSPVAGATFYWIYRYDPTLQWLAIRQVMGAAAMTLKDTTAEPGVQYSYEVAASNSAGTGSESSPFAATSGDTPAAGPSGVWAMPTSGNVLVQWNQVAGATGYVLYKSTKSGGEGSSPAAVLGATSSFNDPEANGTETYYKVAPVMYSGVGLQSPEASAIAGGTPPAPPEVAATALTGSIRLDWTPVSSATKILVFRSIGDALHYSLYATVAGTSTSFADSAVVTGTFYHYQVAGTNAFGAGSTGTAFCKAGGGLPPGSTGLTARPSFATITLFWNPVPGATTYNVYRGSTPETLQLYQTGVQQNQLIDGLVDLYTYYYYRVRAVNRAGTEGYPSPMASALSGFALTAPLIAANVQGTSLSIVIGGVPGASYYNLYRTDDPNGLSGYSQIATYLRNFPTGTDYVVYRDLTASPGESYYYYAAAADLSGEGSASERVGATPGSAAVGAPTGTIAVAGSAFVIVQCDLVAGAGSYNVYRSLTPAMPLIPYANGAENSFTDTKAVPGTLYYYAFTAVDPDGESALSEVCSAQPGSTPPIAPILTLHAASALLQLQWSPVGNATGYDVYRAVPGANYVMVAENLPSTLFNDTGVNVGVQYSYKIYPVSAGGSGAVSNTVLGVPGSVAPPAPDAVAATPSSQSAEVTYNTVLGATSYDIYMSTTAGMEGAVPVVVGAIGGQTVRGLVNGTTYYFEVAAVDGDGQSSLSPEVSVTPGTTPLPAPKLKLVSSQTALTLSWNPLAGAASYNLYRSAAGGPYVLFEQTTGSTFIDSGALHGVTYLYYVAAVNKAGQGFQSNIVNGND